MDSFKPAAAVFAMLLATASAAAGLSPGDAERGEKLYDRCIACHSIDRDRTGPRHEGLVGRRVGSIPGFPYSAAMKEAGARGMVWDESTLDGFLENPLKFLPGTRMTYAGIRDPQQRADLIEFLKEAGGQERAQSR